MRIISGNLKGKSIIYLKSSITRPLKDSVKENIFNIILHSNLIKIRIKDSLVLDLYSGVGSFGLECISREAKETVFVEKSIDALKILKKNLVNLKINSKAKVEQLDVKDFLTKNTFKKFEIIFIDPPFADNSLIKNLEMLKKNKMYKRKHLIIIHRETRSIENLEKLIIPLVIKKYGRSKIIFGIFT